VFCRGGGAFCRGGGRARLSCTRPEGGREDCGHSGRQGYNEIKDGGKKERIECGYRKEKKRRSAKEKTSIIKQTWGMEN